MKKAFGGMKNNVFVFTKQDKTGFAINETKSPADSHFNRWRVDPVPLNQMIVVDEAKMHSLFPSDVVGASEFVDEEATEGYTMQMDEDQRLSEGNVLPYPMEFHSSLTEHMLTVFDADVLVVMRPYGGECFKAVLRKRCWGVGICNSREHRKLIRERLMEYAKHMRLVDLKDAPQKQQELIVWESKRGHGADRAGADASTPQKVTIAASLSGSPDSTLKRSPADSTKWGP